MTINAKTNEPFPRGAFATPADILLDSPRFSREHVIRAAPPQIAYVPPKLSYWCNDRYGTCVTTEEAFAKACYQPEIFIPDSVVEAWARKNGVLNGAYLEEVLDWMVSGGFVVGSQRYNDGGKLVVRYSNQGELQSAIAQGPVKIAIAADALPSGAGNFQGWYTTSSRDFGGTDHCVSLCGYGPAQWLYQQLGVALPSGLSPTLPGYLLFTWSTIGFVTHPWLMGTCQEAWVRNPTTVGVPPLTPIDPPDPPPPPPPPPPVPPTIVTSGEFQIPIIGGPRGTVTVTCGDSRGDFHLVSSGGRRFKLASGKGDEKPTRSPKRKANRK